MENPPAFETLPALATTCGVNFCPCPENAQIARIQTKNIFYHLTIVFREAKNTSLILNGQIRESQFRYKKKYTKYNLEINTKFTSSQYIIS